MMNRDLTQALAICIEAGIPSLLWGNPGGGKSSLMKKLGAHLQRHTEIVISSVREPTDFAGLPVIAEDGVQLHAPAWARRLAGQKGLLFLDEIDQARPATQGALMRVVLDREVGELALGEDVAVVAAANGANGTATQDMGKALPNRFAHFQWKVKASEWIEAKRAGFPLPAISLPGEGWRSGIGFYDGLVAGFLRAHPAAIDGTPTDDSGDVTAFPTARTWDWLTRALAAARSAGFKFNSEVAYLLAQAIIGPATAMQFLAFARELDLPDVEASLAQPDKVQIPERGDRAMIFLEGIVDAALDKHEKSRDRYIAAWTILSRAADDAGKPDVALPAASRLARLRRPEHGVPPSPAMRSFAAILAQIENKA
jgi:hypothetical protein